MAYKEALEANGLEIIEFKEFGSYQGTWIAKTSEGKFIEGSYGSCSGCDAFEAEFGWIDDPTKEQLATFGKAYIDGAETKDEIISRYKVKCSGQWVDSDDREILEWIKSK